MFLASQVPVLKRNKATNFSLLLIIHFSAAMKTLVFGNLFTLLRLPITFARAFAVGNNEKVKTIVIFVFIFTAISRKVVGNKCARDNPER